MFSVIVASEVMFCTYILDIVSMLLMRGMKVPRHKYVHTRTCTPTYAHTHLHARTYIFRHTYTDWLTYTYPSPTHTYTYIYANAHSPHWTRTARKAFPRYMWHCYYRQTCVENILPMAKYLSFCDLTLS